MSAAGIKTDSWLALTSVLYAGLMGWFYPRMVEDTKAIEDIVRAIAARGVKVVMATHDLGEAKRLAGDIVLLHRGRLIENAPAAEFFANPRTPEARKFIAGELLV